MRLTEKSQTTMIGSTMFTFGTTLMVMVIVFASTSFCTSALSKRASKLPHHLLLYKEKLIRGGIKAAKGEFPYQVSLQSTIRGESISICGGVIINNRTIVTAAHCLRELSILRDLKILAGNANIKLQKDMQVRRVLRYYIHPEYHEIDELPKNDIGLITLSVPLEFNEYVSPIKLPQDHSYPSGEAVVSGWGLIGTKEKFEYPDDQYFAEVPIMSKVACAAAIEETAPIGINYNTVLCSGPHDKHSYPAIVENGDSGGGLVQDGTLLGIVSWGSYDVYDVAVYTRVSEYVDWIRKKLGMSKSSYGKNEL